LAEYILYSLMWQWDEATLPHENGIYHFIQDIAYKLKKNDNYHWWTEHFTDKLIIDMYNLYSDCRFDNGSMFKANWNTCCN
jgi:hypothetical protein